MTMIWPVRPAAGPPQTDDPDFDDKADDWVQYEDDLGAALEANSPIIESAYDTAVAASTAANAAILAAANGANLLATSPTEMTVATGAKGPNLSQTGKAFAVGDEIAYIAREDTSARIYGEITSFNAGIGAMNFTATEVKGSGTFSAWYVIPRAFEPFIPPEFDTPIEAIAIPVTDQVYPFTSGTGKFTFRMPYAFHLTEIPRASLKTAQASGSILTVDINHEDVSILSTKLTIDNTERTSLSAATPPVLSTTDLLNSGEIVIDIDQIGNGSAVGLVVYLIGQRIP